MTRLTNSAAAVICSVLLFAGCKSMSGETSGHHLDDSTITTTVKSNLASQDRVGSLTRISVKTVENTVYLTGKVKTDQEKSQAEEIARRVDGVKTVVNNIEVAPEP